MTIRTTSMPFARIGEQWLERLKDEGKSQSTLDCYARDIRDVAVASGFVEAAQLSKLDQAAIDAVAKAWREAGVCDATAIRRFSALRGFAGYLARECSMDLSALLSANFPTAPKRNCPPVMENEIDLLLADAPREGWRDLRDSAMFAVQSGSGLTPVETVKVNVGHVDLAHRLVRIVDTHLTPRVVGLSDRSRDLIGDYLGALPFSLAETEPLFVTSKRKRLNVRSAHVSFRRRRMRLGVSQSATLMGLRHALAAGLAHDGCSPDLLGSALGIGRTSTLRYFGQTD